MSSIQGECIFRDLQLGRALGHFIFSFIGLKRILFTNICSKALKAPPRQYTLNQDHDKQYTLDRPYETRRIVDIPSLGAFEASRELTSLRGT